MAFTQQDNQLIDFISRLRAKAPNLNSAQIMERCRVNFGRHPSIQVQNWLQKDLGQHHHHHHHQQHHKVREDIELWRQGVPRPPSAQRPTTSSSTSITTTTTEIGQ